MSVPTSKIRKFFGLNNKSDPVRLGLGWLAQADNIDITDTGAIVRREGFTQVFGGAITGAYSTRDYRRFYLVVDGNLVRVLDNLSLRTVKAGVATAPMYFTEVNEQVFFTNGVDYGVIAGDDTLRDWRWTADTTLRLLALPGTLPAGQYHVTHTLLMDDGRETGNGPITTIDLLDDGHALQISSLPLGAQVYIAPANSTVFQFAFEATSAAMTWGASVESLGRELNTLHDTAVPVGATQPMVWGGRIYLAQYLPQHDSTVVWKSRPLGFHLFDANEGYFMVSGNVLMMAPTDDALIIGTDRNVFAYNGEGLDMLAEYGVVPGWGWDIDDDKKLVFWTQRGLCSALPFTPLTEERLSVNFGHSAGAAIIRANGRKKFVVALQKGGSAFNQRG